MLGLGRALGETMAVTFVIGNAHRIGSSLLAPGTTISASIANEFTEAVGDLYTSSLVALGALLFLITFTVIAAARLHADAPRAARTVLGMNRRAVRKLTNVVALALSGLATAIGLFFLGAILWTLHQERARRACRSRVFTEMTPPPGSQRRPAECHLRQRRDDRCIGILIGAPDRHAGRHLSGRIRAHDSRLSTVIRFVNDVLLSRAVDHHRPVRLRTAGGAHGALLGDRRRRGARDHRDAGHGAHHRGHAEPGAAGHEGCLDRAWARIPGAPSRASSTRPRAAASSPGCCSRWRASAARRRRCCSPRSTTSSGAPT